MSVRRTTASGLRRLQWTLSGAWSTAWVLGIGVLALVTLRLNQRLHSGELNAQLRLTGALTYGLAWFDAQGEFHDELLACEDYIVNGPFDIWVIEPLAPPVLRLAPEAPRFDVDGLAELAIEVVASQRELTLAGTDTSGHDFRLFAMPTYQDDLEYAAKAAILVVGDPRGAYRAHAAFARNLAMLSLAIGVVGLLVGIVLARWSLRPLASALEQRERFLTAAAHELRTPIASLKAVSESAIAGDESAAKALARVENLARHAADVVEDLLLFARLDAGGTDPDRQPLRLDLLVEASLRDEDAIDLEAVNTVVVADHRLIRVAVRNLIENAAIHASSSGARTRVSVRASSVIVEDDGPGFPDGILSLSRGTFCVAPSHRGAGIGLATVQMIARLHGGDLELQNRPEGGASATLHLI